MRKPYKIGLVTAIVVALLMSVTAGLNYAAAHAPLTPQDTWECSYQRDTLFMSGEAITHRTCTQWVIFTVADNLVRNDEARLVGRCGDKILYLNEEDHFPQGCEWIIRAPNVFAAVEDIYPTEEAAVRASQRRTERTCVNPTDDGRWSVTPCE
jgi:hypothetical protein